MTEEGTHRSGRRWVPRIEPRLGLRSDSAADLLCGLGGSILFWPQFFYLYNVWGGEGLLRVGPPGPAQGRGNGQIGEKCGRRRGRTTEPQDITCAPAPPGNSLVSAAHVATAGQTTRLGLSVSKLQMTELSVPKAALGLPAALPQPRDIPSPWEWCQPRRGLEEAELLGRGAHMGHQLSHPVCSHPFLCAYAQTHTPRRQQGLPESKRGPSSSGFLKIPVS